MFFFAHSYGHSKYSYWSVRNIPGPRPIFPFGYVLAKALYAPQELEIRWATTYGKLYGVYTGLAPTLTVADAALVRQILVTDFRCFVDRRHMNSYHRLWNDNLFMAEGGAWRRLRAITSPAFSVHKLKTMIPLMGACVDQLVRYFERKLMMMREVSGTSNSTNAQTTFIAKDVFAGYTIDVICRAAFAAETDANNVRCDDQDDEKRKNTLVENGKRFFNLNPLKILTILVLPRPVLNWLNLRQPFKDDTFYFFANFARAVVRARRAELADTERQSPKRVDLVQLLLDAVEVEEGEGDRDDKENLKDKLASSKTLTEDEIVAQCILFLAAGFETTSASLTFALFELVNHVDVEEKLYKEVAQKDHKLEDDDFILHHCPYLEAVIKETTRLYSPVVRLERRVGVHGYQLKEGLILEKGTLIEIPPR